MLQLNQQKLRTHHRLLVGLIFVTLCLVLASANHVHAEEPSAETKQSQVIPVPNPASDLWRAVRQREGDLLPTTTQVRGVDTAVLVSESAEIFRDIRRERLVPYLPYVLFGVIFLIVLFYFLRGKIEIDDGYSGTYVERFRDFERLAHWFLAIIFIFLALTGLILLFGRFVIIPLFGKEAFSLIASACKEGHNLMGPLFLVGLVLVFLLFVSRNIPAKGDLSWMINGGGFVKHHVKAGFFNAGEKVWFWLVVLLGLTVSVSGLILDFPVFEQGRSVMQVALIVHSIAAVVFIAISFGHIYLATIGTEGTLTGMTTGKVDANWAKTHHDLWYQELGESDHFTDEYEPAPNQVSEETARVST